jgi:ADP-heptose:LPS heptosyltransferase
MSGSSASGSPASGSSASGSSRTAPALGPDLVPPPPVEGVRRIAVLRANGIGDYVTIEPALTALRAAYPDAELTLLGARHHRALVEGRPGPCDRFVAVPLMPGVRAGVGPDADQQEVDAFFAGQQAYGYDLAVQMHGGGRFSNPVVRRLGARVTAGAATPDAAPLDREVPYSFNQHEVLRWLDVAAACGAPTVRRQPRLLVTAAELAEADEVLAGRGPGRGAGEPGERGGRGGRTVAIHPGATDPRRRWPVERLVEVAAALPGARVLLLGGPDERPRTEVAVSAATALGLRVADLTGATGLGGLLGLLARTDLFLGNDSGPRHLAEALGTPTVAVFSNANLADVAPLSRVWHRVAVSWASRCAACGAPVQLACGHDATALGDVGSDEVRDLAVDLWNQVGRWHADPARPSARVEGDQVEGDPADEDPATFAARPAA